MLLLTSVHPFPFRLGCIISGESGAGKTETARQFLRYIGMQINIACLLSLQRRCCVVPGERFSLSAFLVPVGESPVNLSAINFCQHFVITSGCDKLLYFTKTLSSKILVNAKHAVTQTCTIQTKFLRKILTVSLLHSCRQRRTKYE